MIAPTALSSLSFPWILIEKNGNLIKEGSGALFPKPDYEIDSILGICTSLSDGGWAICPNGYGVFRFTTNIISPASIVLHGLKVNGLSKAKGRINQLSINLSKVEVIAYVQEYFKGLEALDDQYRALIRQNIHEVRGINSALYNSAFELQELLTVDAYQQRGVQASISKSVVSLSELLRGRIDFMEFIANPNMQSVTKGDIAVYRKFDKVQRCFRQTAYKRGIEFDIAGSSVKTVYGPPIFDLVPYLLLDNAVKYSPDNFPVKIVCNDATSSVFCAVTSRGPRISESEVSNIFIAGVRGENALKSKKEGSGLGLAALHKIVKEVFSGSITVSQSEDKSTVHGVPYCDVTFEIKLPSRI
jgi:signal transduction histidine kinase